MTLRYPLGPPTSLEEVRNNVYLSFLNNSGNEDTILKHCFDTWYQSGLPLEWRQFKNLCEDLKPSKQKKQAIEYWWQKY